MSNSVPTYRISNEDLPDLDKKNKEALQPLIDNLNNTLGQVVPAVNAIVAIDKRDITFTTKTSLADTFPIVFNTVITAPFAVFIGGKVVCPVGTDTSAGISVNGWVQLQNGNISVKVISGLVPNTKYTLTFVVI